MANMSNYLEERLLNHLFRGTVFNAPSTLYIALLTDTIDDSVILGADLPEVSGGNYARKPIVSAAASWTAMDTEGTIKNVNEVKWENVTWQAEVKGIAICDSLNPLTGNVLFWGDLLNAKNVLPDDSISFSANSITIQIDNDKETP